MKYIQISILVMLIGSSFTSFGQGRFKKLKEQLKEQAGGGDMSDDPNYYYASHKATYLSDFPHVDGFLLQPSHDREGADLWTKFGKGPKKGASLRFPTLDYSKRLTELYGKPAYIGQQYCIETENGEVCFNRPGGETRAGRTLQPEEGVYLYYGGNCVYGTEGDQAYYPYIEEYLSTTSLSEHPVFIMAKTPELLAAWTQERAKKEIGALEDKIKAKVESDGKARLANTRLPHQGGMHTTSNFSRAEGLVKALCEKDGTTYKELVLTSDQWKVVYKPGTEIIDYRIFMGYFADYNPKRDWCLIHTVSFRENYSGGSYSGEWFIAGVGQDPNVGPIVDCDNVGK